MKRYSLLWWSVILPTSVVVGAPTFLLVRYLTGWAAVESAVAALVATLLADLAIAASMEAIAPTRVHIGPGEKFRDSEMPIEKATVIAGFGASTQGQVSIRGETWSATQSPDDTGVLAAGMVVSVVDRNGLKLVIKTRAD